MTDLIGRITVALTWLRAQEMGCFTNHGHAVAVWGRWEGTTK